MTMKPPATKEQFENFMQQIAEPPLSNTITAFAGADMIISLDGDVYGEGQKVYWEENFSAEEGQPAVTGYVDFAFFNRDFDFVQAAKEGKEFNIVLTFCNEYGLAAATRIFGATFKKRSASTAIDDIVSSHRYTFEANKVSVIDQKELKEQGVVITDLI